MRPLHLLSGAVLLFSGCMEMYDSVRNGGMPIESDPQIRSFAADPKATYKAALGAIAQMDYRFTGGGPAQGELRATSRVSTGDDRDSTHQFILKARFDPTLDGTGTSVSVWMTEVLESDAGRIQRRGVASSLQDTSLPQVFFDYIQQGLGTPAKKG